jgi:toluene methyl-monooxygenase electron transfer component
MTDPTAAERYSVKLVPSGKEFFCRADQTLLDACILAGVAVPYNCRSGECGECMAALMSGQVHELPGADPAVFTDTHRAQGDILTCMCFPRSLIVLNVALQMQADTIRPATFNVLVKLIERLTPTIFGVTVETPWPIEFRAGQNFEWVLPGIAPNRTFSAANRPGDRVIDFHVRVYPGGKVGEFVSGISAGYAFQMIGPFGQFGLSAHSWRPCVCVAGGTGLAPILSSLDRAFAEGDRRPITLIYGARTREELYCLEKINSWSKQFSSFTFIPVLSDEPDDLAWRGKRGLVTEALADHLGDVFGLEAYVCGPPAMIDGTVRALERAGVQPEDIRTDRFSQVKS